MELDEIVEQLKDDELIIQNSFYIAKSIASLYNNTEEQKKSKVQELVLRAMDKYDLFGTSQGIIESLLRELGLFPYLDSKKLELRDLLLKFRSSFYLPKESKSIESPCLKLKRFGVKLQDLYKKALYVSFNGFQNYIYCFT